MSLRYACKLLVPLVLACAATQPAMAYKWPGEGPSPGGAISAKVIGEACADTLTKVELTEIDRYLERAGRELSEKYAAESGGADMFQYDDFKTGLTATYRAKYQEPGACDHQANVEARDMLRRVRSAMVSSAPLYPPRSHPNWRPDIADAMAAKLTAERCTPAMTAVDVAELQLYIAKVWMRWVNSSSEEDARTTMRIYAKTEADLQTDKRAGECSEAAIEQAKLVVSVARKP